MPRTTATGTPRRPAEQQQDRERSDARRSWPSASAQGAATGGTGDRGEDRGQRARRRDAPRRLAIEVDDEPVGEDRPGAIALTSSGRTNARPSSSAAACAAR